MTTERTKGLRGATPFFFLNQSVVFCTTGEVEVWGKKTVWSIWMVIFLFIRNFKGRLGL